MKDDYLAAEARFDSKQLIQMFQITHGIFKLILQELARDDSLLRRSKDCTKHQLIMLGDVVECFEALCLWNCGKCIHRLLSDGQVNNIICN